MVAWLVGFAAAILLAIGVIALNIQKLIIVLATALLGAAVIVGTFLLLFGQLPPQQLVANPVQSALQDSPFWMMIFVVVAALGIVVQFVSSRRQEIETYNRWKEIYASTE